MKKAICTLLLLIVFFSAKAAKIDTIQVFSASMNKNIKTCVIVPDGYKKAKRSFQSCIYFMDTAGIMQLG